MARSRVVSAVSTVVLSVGVAAGIVFLGASGATRTPGVTLDCRSDLRIQANFVSAHGERGADTPTDAVTDVADKVIRARDRTTTRDGNPVILNGSRTVAAVFVIKTSDGYFAEGIEACAEDYVSP